MPIRNRAMMYRTAFVVGAIPIVAVVVGLKSLDSNSTSIAVSSPSSIQTSTAEAAESTGSSTTTPTEIKRDPADAQ